MSFTHPSCNLTFEVLDLIDHFDLLLYLLPYFLKGLFHFMYHSHFLNHCLIVFLLSSLLFIFESLNELKCFFGSIVCVEFFY